MARDYYDILGLSKSASDSDIKSSYRKLAMKYHPDRNPGDKKAEENFREITESYEILKDPQKRAAYDQYGHAAFSQGSGGGNPVEDFLGSEVEASPIYLKICLAWEVNKEDVQLRQVLISGMICQYL